MRRIHHTYPLFVWTATLIIPPILFGLVDIVLPLIGLGKFFGILNPIYVIFLTMAFGVFNSIPALVIFWIMVEVVVRINLSETNRKIILASSGVIIIFTTLLIVISPSIIWEMPDILYLPITYSLILVIATMLLKMKPN